MMKYILPFLFFCAGTFAQQPLQLSVSYSSFRFDSAKSYMEVYFALSNQMLSYKAEASAISGGVSIALTVEQNDSTEIVKQWIMQHTVTDSTELTSEIFLMDAVGLAIIPGNHTMKILASDVHKTERIDSLTFALHVPDFSKTKILLSEIELCSNIIEATSEQEKLSPFFKGKNLVYPNPNEMYGEHLPVLFYYLECYNLLLNTSLQNYTLVTSVFNTLKEEIIHKEKSKLRTVNDAVEIGTVNISKLKSGSYTFVITYHDSLTSAQASKRFFIYNPKQGMDSAMVNINATTTNEYEIMSNEALHEQFSMAHYIATQQELEQYGKISTVEGKRKFLHNFWQQRGSEYKAEYFKRIDEANELYSTARKTKFAKAGWKSDKGRVRILFGVPEEIKSRASSPQVTTYEIWNYNTSQGLIVFYFIDEFNTNQWRLVHSNARGEIFDKEWERKIETYENDRLNNFK